MGIHTYDVSMKARLKAQALVFAALFTILKFAGNRVALRPRFHAYVSHKCVFTSMAEDLSFGRPTTNSASGRSWIRILDRRISSPTH